MQRRITLGTAVALAVLASNIAVAQPAPVTPAPSPEEMAEEAAYRVAPDTPGSGPYAAIKDASLLPGYVVYRPKDLAKLGTRKLGIVAWGNGGCFSDAASARLHLLEIASHGYLAIAPGKVKSGPGIVPEPPRGPIDWSKFRMETAASDLTKAIDWATAENARTGSMLRGHIDTDKVAVSGHSCGGVQALQGAVDPRVRTAVIHNSGIFPDEMPVPANLNSIKKDHLAKIQIPMIYVLGGPTDIAQPNGLDDFTRLSSIPVMVADLNVGHMGTFRKPNGGLAAQVAVNWLEWQLYGDKQAAAQFVGENCGLCGDSRWTVRKSKID